MDNSLLLRIEELDVGRRLAFRDCSPEPQDLTILARARPQRHASLGLRYAHSRDSANDTSRAGPPAHTITCSTRCLRHLSRRTTPSFYPRTRAATKVWVAVRERGAGQESNLHESVQSHIRCRCRLRAIALNPASTVPPPATVVDSVKILVPRFPGKRVPRRLPMKSHSTMGIGQFGFAEHPVDLLNHPAVVP